MAPASGSSSRPRASGAPVPVPHDLVEPAAGLVAKVPDRSQPERDCMSLGCQSHGSREPIKKACSDANSPLGNPLWQRRLRRYRLIRGSDEAPGGSDSVKCFDLLQRNRQEFLP